MSGMPEEWIIVDGNNLLHAARKQDGAGRRPSFESARWQLARRLDELVGTLAKRITLVFDGSRGGQDDAFETAAVEVVYSPGNLTADAVIERLVYDCGDASHVLVVTSDRAEGDAVASAGGGVMSCERFLADLEDQRRHLDGRLRGSGSAPGGAKLGDFFPGDK